MIFKIAWRNIWRSKMRSFTVIGAIVIGVWALLFFLGFTGGFIDTYVSSAIENELSHIQLHHPKFMDEKEVEYYVEDVETVAQKIKANENVKAHSQRAVFNGMLTTPRGARGVQIKGIIPEQEAAVSFIDKKLKEGSYFTESKKRNPVILSKRLADKLKVKLKSKIVLSFQNHKGELETASFKIIGLYQTGNAAFEERNIFVEQSDLYRLLDSTKVVHEIAMLLNDADKLLETQDKLQASISDTTKHLIENYREVSPDVNLYESQMSVSTWVIIVIVMLALVFGIINTMLMAVLERTREFGMLMAVGMKRREVFGMIVFETILLGLIAAPFGLLFGYLTVTYFGAVGIDLSAFQQGMEKFGLSDVVYTRLALRPYIEVTLSVVVTAILGAIYPAIKATRLKPVEAIRKI